MSGPSPEHESIAIAIGTEVVRKVLEVLPDIQSHLIQGKSAGGLNIRAMMRPGGGPGEGPLVFELEFNSLTGSELKLNVAPSPQSGEFMLLQQPVAPVATPPLPANAPQQPWQPNPPDLTQYPAAQLRPAPTPLVPRAAQMPVPDGFIMPQDQPGLTGAMPTIVVPQGQDPNAFAEAYNAQQGPHAAPTAPNHPVRLQRPMFQGEALGAR